MNFVLNCPQNIRDAETAPLFELQTTPTISKCFKVYDGDTCRFMIDLHGKLQAFKARILHINTAEMRTKCSVEKKIATMAKKRAKELLEQTIVLITVTGTDLYGRKLVEIQLPDGRMYHTVLLDEHLAMPYEGTKKFGQIVVPSSEISSLCSTCRSSPNAQKNCYMWRQLMTFHHATDQ